MNDNKFLIYNTCKKDCLKRAYNSKNELIILLGAIELSDDYYWVLWNPIMDKISFDSCVGHWYNNFDDKCEYYYIDEVKKKELKNRVISYIEYEYQLLINNSNMYDSSYITSVIDNPLNNLIYFI